MELYQALVELFKALDGAKKCTSGAIRLQYSWTGNLFDFFFRVNSKLTRDLKIPFKLEGITRIDDTPVHKALREALANCLINSDFCMPRGLVIRKEQDIIIL